MLVDQKRNLYGRFWERFPNGERHESYATEGFTMPRFSHSHLVTSLTTGIVVLLAMAGAFVASPARPASAATEPAKTSCDNFYSTAVASGKYRVQNNVWNDAAGTQCLRVQGTRFDLTRSNHRKATSGPPASYASIYKGCHYRACTTNSGLPQRVANMQRVRVDWSTTNIASGAYNTSLDLWFDPRKNFGDINAGEIMVWINHRGGPRPAGSRVGTVKIDGTAYDLWKGVLRDDSKRISWVVVTYLRKTHVRALVKLDVRNITRDATRRGYINRSWYLNSVQAGFEVWTGGRGLRTNSFQVHTR
jgi:hypothetical protein